MASSSAKVSVPENVERNLPVACKNVIGVDAQKKSHGNEDHMSHNCDKELTPEEFNNIFGHDHRACTREHTAQDWKDYFMKKFESSLEEPESPLMEEPEWLVDTGPATRDLAWRKFLGSTYEPPLPGTKIQFF